MELTAESLRPLLYERQPMDHKGTFGHALIVAGSYGKIGAALLATRACLRSGAGLVTVHVPACGYNILQLGAPEAMCSTDVQQYYLTKTDFGSSFAAIGVGPGLGQAMLTAKAVDALLGSADCPLVLDADALNLIAAHGWVRRIPRGAVLTPHPGEFERLFGATGTHEAAVDLQREMAEKHGFYLILKTGRTTIATPEGRLYTNTTGNPGMGSGGMGDVLTGLLTGLLAQPYDTDTAIQLGVFLHGAAGDRAAGTQGQGGLLAGDVVEEIGPALWELARG